MPENDGCQFKSLLNLNLVEINSEMPERLFPRLGLPASSGPGFAVNNDSHALPDAVDNGEPSAFGLSAVFRHRRQGPTFLQGGLSEAFRCVRRSWLAIRKAIQCSFVSRHFILPFACLLLGSTTRSNATETVLLEHLDRIGVLNLSITDAALETLFVKPISAGAVDFWSTGLFRFWYASHAGFLTSFNGLPESDSACVSWGIQDAVVGFSKGFADRSIR
ncbi:hypothetical protein C8J56DRAFT_1060998 [Mycena floridula]|nr:hypothetical protein C8J56DRAFT_1060998 [Mycena floridula]